MLVVYEPEAPALLCDGCLLDKPMRSEELVLVEESEDEEAVFACWLSDA